MARDTQFFKEHLSLIVLSVLRSGAMYGYELAQAVKLRSRDMLELREGVLYPVLHQMVEQGLLTSQWGDSEKGPRRRYYRLTQKGKTVQSQRVDRWHQFVGAIDRLIGAQSCMA